MTENKKRKGVRKRDGHQRLEFRQAENLNSPVFNQFSGMEF
jgi:hypothetical protein